METRTIVTLLSPARTVFGVGSWDAFLQDVMEVGLKRLFVVGFPALEKTLPPGLAALSDQGIAVRINTAIAKEPKTSDLERVLADARDFHADGVVGIGGGSVLDVAKVVAALLDGHQTFAEIIGNGLLRRRGTYLACIPTTAGTGSEMSPNALLTDGDGKKVAAISPFLVPDAVYVDPVLTVSVPPATTAATGIDALAHCMEAYTNIHAHAAVDLYALEGIRLVGTHLKAACDDGTDLVARTGLALGSMYGGMCLGPVNTAAAHALAYPLSEFHGIPHGLSVALVLPAVMRYNIPWAVERYARVAVALGAASDRPALQTALEGSRLLSRLIADCGLPTSLAAAGVPKADLGRLAPAAWKVQRLLANNPRPMQLEDIDAVYRDACWGPDIR